MIQLKVRRKNQTCFNAYFQYSQSKSTGVNTMQSLKSLTMLKSESRTSPHAVQYKQQPGSVLMFCSYYFKNGQRKQFVLAMFISVRVEPVHMQYKISDSQAVFRCFVIIILRMASLNNLFLRSVGHYKMCFIYNYSQFQYSFCNEPVLFAQLENEHKLWNNYRTVHVNEFKIKT